MRGVENSFVCMTTSGVRKEIRKDIEESVRNSSGGIFQSTKRRGRDESLLFSGCSSGMYVGSDINCGAPEFCDAPSMSSTGLTSLESST